MTLRQIWRFLRDCQVIGSDATIAQIDRVYYNGRKNHFTLLSQKDKNKILMSSGKGDIDPVGGEGNAKEAAGGAGHEEQKLPNIDDSAIKKDDDESADEDEEEENEAIGKIFDLPPEDIHQASKVVLQR